MGIFDFLNKKRNKVDEEKRTRKKTKGKGKQDIDDKREAKCPNCNKELDKVPGAKTKCPHCGKYMYVRTTPIKRERLVVTEKEKEDIDFNKSLSKNIIIGVIRKSDILKRFEEHPSNDLRDIIWSLCNERILKSKKRKDYRKLQDIYLVMEKILAYEEKDWQRSAKERLKFQAIEQKENGIPFIIPTASMGGKEDKLCKVCKELDGREIKVDKFIEEKPVPPMDCKCEKYRYWIC
ncbi:MAG: hypothetical protein ACOCRX_08540 [Candidatus Woesearchaeota archaeon]